MVAERRPPFVFADIYLFDQGLDEKLPLALIEAREIGDEILELVRDSFRVVALFLQVTDLVFDCPLRLLEPGLFFGKPVYLGVDEVDGLGGRLGAKQPAGELLLLRPESGEAITTLIEAYNRLAGTTVSVEQTVAEARSTGHGFIEHWIETVKTLGADENGIVLQLERSFGSRASLSAVAEPIVAKFERRSEESGTDSDLAEDLTAWRELVRDIGLQIGRNAPVDHFLQELELRSKSPTPSSDTVRLMTIHGAKGMEFDWIFLIGLAEDIMPSFQSKQKGDTSPEMEEERRNCFVAITRTRERLILSHGKAYRNWIKKPSRFLREMEVLAESDPP